VTDSRLNRLYRAAWVRVTLLAFAGVLVLSAPARAQIDLSGAWSPENTQDYQIRLFGPQYAEYAGIPLNAAGRAAAMSYSPDTIDQLQRQCQPWGTFYLLLGPFGMQISSTANRLDGSVQAWNITGVIDRVPISIWMDGRAPPSAQALRTYSGYATGQWRGDTLVVQITGMKDGYLTRNGIPSSGQAKLTLFITRHEQLLNILGVFTDPVYLTQPYVLSRTWRQVFGNGTEIPPMTCMPHEEIPTISDGRHVATLLPGRNPMLRTDLEKYNLPLWATAGGAETMYPEFRKRLQKEYTVPTEYCKEYCCGSGSAGGGMGLRCGAN